MQADSIVILLFAHTILKINFLNKQNFLNKLVKKDFPIMFLNTG